MRTVEYWIFVLIFSGLGLFHTGTASAQNLSDQVVVKRTAFGIPHIYADNMKAAGYAMAYVQMEDYGGQRMVNRLMNARGDRGKYAIMFKPEQQIDRDAANRRKHARAVETYPLLSQDYRDILEGFAMGVNRYIEVNRKEFMKWVQPFFTGQDVHALGIGEHSSKSVSTFLKALKEGKSNPVMDENYDPVAAAEPSHINEELLADETIWTRLVANIEPTDPDDGSNVWAFAPSRTKSGKAILMRNPHLTWGAGYYEAHVVVPGKLNFYGDFRVGQPIGIVCGFNQHLGWSTTNNYTDTDEIYAFEADPNKSDHYILDGKSHPLIKEYITVESRRKGGVMEEATREFVSTPYGPVIHRDKDKIYIIRSTTQGEYRSREQFLQMMMATNLEEWKEAMRINGRSTSNFTYADKEGNIFYVWNARMPKLTHPSGGDTTAIFVKRSDQIWTDIISWDSLPQLLNPKGGYLRNENSSFHFTNLNEVFNEKDWPSNFAKPSLNLRSQLSLELVGGEEKFSLEEIVDLKHNMRALLADRVKDDLIKVIRSREASGELAEAADLLEKWDNTLSVDSRGSLLFETWWNRYRKLKWGDRSMYAEPWSAEHPTTTPRGLSDTNRAFNAFKWAIEACKEDHGGWDLAWGEVHRARIGSKDFPIGGGAGRLGAFRVLTFKKHEKDSKKRQVRGGDGWVSAVEFGDTPKAYSILAYGQSNKKNSPHYNDQLEMFANNEMKPVAFTEEDVQRYLIREYRPGKE